MSEVLDKIKAKIEEQDTKIKELEFTLKKQELEIEKLKITDHSNMNRVAGVIGKIRRDINGLIKHKEKLIFIYKITAKVIAILAALAGIASFIFSFFK